MDLEQIALPITMIRGGTSKGIFLLESDLPEDRTLWGPYLIELLGSRSSIQIDGLGGGLPVTSKACIIGAHPDPDIDVTYTFAQVGIGEEVVYWDVNCGNLSSAVGTFAILAGFVPAVTPSTIIRVYQANTQKLMSITVPVGAAGPLVNGSFTIPGVPGSGASVQVDFSATVGASLGRDLFPTGNRRDRLVIPDFGEIEVTIADLANMCVFFHAGDLGFTGTEGTALAPRLAPVFSKVRVAAQELLGLEIGGSTPWPISIAPAQTFTSSTTSETIPADSYDVAARFAGVPAMGTTMPAAFPTTGAACLSVAAVTEGTIVHDAYAKSPRRRNGVVALGHPSGVAEADAEVSDSAGEVHVHRASASRTVRLLLEGKAYLRLSELERLQSEISFDTPTRAAVPREALFRSEFRTF